QANVFHDRPPLVEVHDTQGDIVRQIVLLDQFMEEPACSSAVGTQRHKGTKTQRKPAFENHLCGLSLCLRAFVSLCPYRQRRQEEFTTRQAVFGSIVYPQRRDTSCA